MLPHGFKWDKTATFETVPSAIYVNDMVVSHLVQRIDGSWYVKLDCHLPIPGGCILRPSRNCQSYESGRAGCEIWAARHEARLRAETAEIHRAKWGG